MDKKYPFNIFISYRRDGGELGAQVIYEHLVRLGYSVFYDIETMTAGQFDETLLTRIEEASDFVLILSKNALDRCDSEADWVRREIAHALKMNKNIIPVMLRGFAFPTNLPEDIAPIRLRHGVIFESMELFEAKVQKLTALFQSSPTNAPRNVSEDGGSYIPRSNLPSYIANVCSIGTNDPTETWPRGTFTPDINIDENTTVRFAVSLLHPFGKAANLPITVRIFDEKTGNMVFENESSIYFRVDDDRFSTGWVVKNDDGSYQNPGSYRAEFTVNGSRPFVYQFRLYTQRTGTFYHPQSPYGEVGNAPHSNSAAVARIRALQDNLTRPKGALWGAIWLTGVIIFWTNMIKLIAGDYYYDEEILAGTFFVLISIGIMLFGFVMLCIYCKKNVWDSGLGTFLLCFLLPCPFCVYLFFTAIRTMVMRSAWLKELAEYGAPIKR